MRRLLTSFWRERTFLGWLAGLRIYVGYCLLTFGWQKLTGGFLDFTRRQPALQGMLSGWAAHMPPGWYHDFLVRMALPHHHLLAYLVVYGELLAGAALVAGLCTRLAALAALIMNINYLFATGWLGPTNRGYNQSFIAIELALFFAAAGRALGLDVFLYRRWPKGLLW